MIEREREWRKTDKKGGKRKNGKGRRERNEGILTGRKKMGEWKRGIDGKRDVKIKKERGAR